MNKLLLIISALLMSLGALAQDAYKTLTFPDDNSANNANSAYTETWTAKIGNDEWTITNFNNNKWNNWTYIRCGRKNNASVASISSPAIDQPIGSVVVTIDKVTASSVNSIKLVVASDADFSSEVETVTAETIEKGDMTFTTTKAAANNYYKLVFDCASASSNGVIQISKVAYYAASTSNKEAANMKFSEAKVSVEQGKEFTAPTFSKSTDAEVTFSSDNEKVATVATDGTISLAGGIGKAVITATAAETDKYYAGTATTTIEVFIYNTYKKVTTITDGKQYLLVAQRNDSTVYAYPLDEKNTYGYVSVGTIKKLTDEISIKSTYDDSFTLTADENNTYSIKDCYGRYYYQSGKYNSFQLSTEAGDDKLWTVEAQDDGTFKFTQNGYIIQWGNGTYKTFAAYQTVTGVLPYLYQLDETPTAISNTVVKKAALDEAPAYNLAGQRVGKNYKGVVVKNGKKYIVR